MSTGMFLEEIADFNDLLFEAQFCWNSAVSAFQRSQRCRNSSRPWSG
jgi:hypothetical protein